jgi:F-type H+-transporting ATPase subunit b
MPRKPILLPGLLLALALLSGAPAAPRAGIVSPDGAGGAARAAAPIRNEHAQGAAAGNADASHDAAGAAHGGQPNILEPQAPLAFWTLVVFLVLLAVLWKFAWGPLSKALHDREHHFQHALEETERARAEAQQLLAQHREQMEKAHQQVQAMLDEGRRDALANAEQIQRAAQAEAEATKRRALNDIESARDQALTEIWSKTADLAVGIAGKVLDRELGPDDHRRLIDQAMAELPAAANGHRGQG